MGKSCCFGQKEACVIRSIEVSIFLRFKEEETTSARTERNTALLAAITLLKMSLNSVDTIKQWASEKKLNQVRLSDDGSEVALGDVSLSGSDKVVVSYGDKACEYSVASLFLQILDPDQGLLGYRAACTKHKVQDPVKASDKPVIVGFFLGEEATVSSVSGAIIPKGEAAEAQPLPASSEAPEDFSKLEPSVNSNNERRHHHEKKHHHERHSKSSSSRSRDRHLRDKRSIHSSSTGTSEKEKKKVRKTIDNEKLFSNLNVVVDKRSQAQKQNELQKALCPEGFEVTPELLQEYKESSQSILSWEIPVGDSASILQAAAGKDLSRILKLYMDTVHPSKASRQGTPSQQPQQKSFRAYLVGKKPIIVLPKGMTAPITLINAHEFFANSRFVPRDIMMKKGQLNRQPLQTTFTRRIASRLGGGQVEYELMDNPKSKLHTAQDWDRVVAVIALGASWQFKDWPKEYNEPVHLFGRVYGFYIGMEGDKVPSELQGWSVVHAKLNRDKRGMDSVTYASFWNGLDEFMAIHKPELLPQQET